MAEHESASRIIRQLRGGQITIPAVFRRRLGIGPDTLLRVTVADGELRLRPVRSSDTAAGSAWLAELYAQFAPVRQEAEQKHYSEEEVNEAIDRAVRAVRRSDA